MESIAIIIFSPRFQKSSKFSIFQKGQYSYSRSSRFRKEYFTKQIIIQLFQIEYNKWKLALLFYDIDIIQNYYTILVFSIKDKQ